MKNLYTLVAYLPNGDSYCRGCHMGSTSSDFELNQYDNITDVVKRMAHFDYINTTDENYSTWDYTLLVNGQDLTEFYQPDDVFGHEGYELMTALVDWAKELVKEKQAVEKEKQEKIAAENLAKAHLAREAAERKQLEELQRKYQ